MGCATMIILSSVALCSVLWLHVYVSLTLTLLLLAGMIYWIISLVKSNWNKFTDNYIFVVPIVYTGLVIGNLLIYVCQVYVNRRAMRGRGFPGHGRPDSR